MSVTTRPPPRPQASTPRPSASLLIVNSRNEILLVHRNPEAKAFGGVHVFPGGNFDAKQDDSLAMTAIRETFEESGLLIASSAERSHTPYLSDVVVESARHSIHSQRTLFKDFLVEHHLQPDTGSLLRFTSWITPKQVPRRFNAQFYVAFLPAAPSAGFSSGNKQDRIPTPDGGQEVISARFLHPLDALSEFRTGKITLMPPQFYLLSTLAEVLTGRTNTPEQREKVTQLSKGLFGRMVINPMQGPDSGDERTVLTFEGDETRGGSTGRMHRALVRFGKAGIPSQITLQRNFDVFTEIEPHAFTERVKL